jgi:hypothetical protein
MAFFIWSSIFLGRTRILFVTRALLISDIIVNKELGLILYYSDHIRKGKLLLDKEKGNYHQKINSL